MYAVLRSHPSRPKTNTVGLFRRQSLYPAELRVHVRQRSLYGVFPALVKPKRMKSARGAQNRKKACPAGRRSGEKGGRGPIWAAIVAVTLLTLLFAWALCKAAAEADRQMAEAFIRRQAEALGGRGGRTGAKKRAREREWRTVERPAGAGMVKCPGADRTGKSTEPQINSKCPGAGGGRGEEAKRKIRSTANAPARKERCAGAFERPEALPVCPACQHPEPRPLAQTRVQSPGVSASKRKADPSASGA